MIALARKKEDPPTTDTFYNTSESDCNGSILVLQNSQSCSRLKIVALLFLCISFCLHLNISKIHLVLSFQVGLQI